MKNPDYNRLYLELDLRPDCSVDDLRHAYRRHVAGLHPDRGDHDRRRDGGSLPLSDLNALYDEATRFHKRYGRLPGAPQPLPARGPVHAAAAAAPAPSGVAVTPAPTTGGSGRRVWLALVLVATVAAALVLGSPEPAGTTATPEGATAMPVAPDPTSPARPSHLALGMDADTVLAIQGAPMRRSDVEWTYGPSWLRFERGKLVDWYSSRLRPLRTRGARPTPADGLAEEAP